MQQQPWLRGARWDIGMLVGSVTLAVVPYCIYVVLGGSASEEASIAGSVAYRARLAARHLYTGDGADGAAAARN